MAARRGARLRPADPRPRGRRPHPGGAPSAARRRAGTMKALAWILPAVTVLAFLVIIGPIAIVVLAAFSPTEFFTFPPPGLSLRWFLEFFRLDNMRDAFALSLELALAAASLATVLVGTPYCFRAVLTSLQVFDFTQEEAGQSLGAGPFRTFFLITLPQIWPGVLAGWFFALIVSFGELNTALFLTGPGQTTLPIEIFSYLQFQGSQLVIAAASALQIGLILVLIVAIERLVGLARLTRS